MSGDYIRRGAAIEQFEDSTSAIPEKLARIRIESVPAADVVEVVRCKDCKYRAEDDFCTGRGWPDQLVADDGFCEKGKGT